MVRLNWGWWCCVEPLIIWIFDEPNSSYLARLHPDFVKTLHSWEREWSWWSQFTQAYLPDQETLEVIVSEGRPNVKSGIFRIHLSLVRFAYMITNPWLTSGFGFRPTCCNKAKSASVYFSFCGERLRIFVLLHFQTLSVTLTRLVCNQKLCSDLTEFFILLCRCTEFRDRHLADCNVSVSVRNRFHESPTSNTHFAFLHQCVRSFYSKFGNSKSKSLNKWRFTGS